MKQSNKKRVVIVGGGYGGVMLARKLKHYGLQVFIIDKYNYHQFQPLFYQVATAGLEAISISYPFRRMFHGYNDYHFRLAELKGIDSNNNKIETNIGEINYDYLVIATGADNNFFGNKNFEKYSYQLKSISESIALRNKIIQNNEDAICVKDKAERKGILSIAIVGGGPTGIEMAGALSEMRKHVFPKDYPELNYNDMEIYLYDSSLRLLKGMSEISSIKATIYLNKLGVNIRLNKRILDYDGRNLHFADGSKLRTNTLIWAAGVKCNKIDGLNEKVYCYANRIRVDRFNRINGYDNIFAIGDVAYMCEDKFPEGHPQLAEVAIQQAKLLAKNLMKLKLSSGTFNEMSLHKFLYKDKGVMATIGRNLAVAETPNLKFQGRLAWYFFMFVHLMSILVVKNRLFKFMHWCFKYFTYDKSLRFIIKQPVKTDE